MSTWHLPDNVWVPCFGSVQSSALPTKVPARGAPAAVQLQESPVREGTEERWKQRRQSTQSLTSQGTSGSSASRIYFQTV